MPLYEYHCNKCELNFETLVTDNKEDLTCTNCNSNDLKKLFSTFGVNSSNESNISDNDIAKTGCCSNTGCGCN